MSEIFEKEGFNEMYRVLCSIISRPESSAFREPVDWKGMGLPDYPEIIKHPMDLGTVKKGMESLQYETLDNVAADIRLVWRNCMIYNRDGSEFYHLADKFARGFEEAYAALRKLGDSKSDMDRIPSLEEKLQLSYDVFKVTNVDMGHVLTLVEASCPSAISRRAATDEVLVDFDRLEPRCFHDANAFVQRCILSITSGKKTRKRKADEGTSEPGAEGEVAQGNGSSSGGAGASAEEGKRDSSSGAPVEV
ncbi:Bromodomain-containing protein [Ochromonadaceae sp. CCMP2298]|nr:Bromodomain-containing protein [Ochromonadaceae sp. CCMP2298]|mmetsp:Transcript_23154/g.51434  ORF Transcript_23154/g.51434 Transcript_23154/m.51434 type:complete len:249 (+) Transcript_23154:134-880(+)